MAKEIQVYGTERKKVWVNPIDVLEGINIINSGDWIIEKDGKYIQMTEESAGQHSFDNEVKEVSKEIFDLYEAKKLLIGYLKKQDT